MGARRQAPLAPAASGIMAVYRCCARGRSAGRGRAPAERPVRRGVSPRRGTGPGTHRPRPRENLPRAAPGAGGGGGYKAGAGLRGRGAFAGRALAGASGDEPAAPAAGEQFRAYAGRYQAGAACGGGADFPIAGLSDREPPRRARAGGNAVGQIGAGGRWADSRPREQSSRDFCPRRGERAASTGIAGKIMRRRRRDRGAGRLNGCRMTTQNREFSWFLCCTPVSTLILWQKKHSVPGLPLWILFNCCGISRCGSILCPRSG